MGAKEEMGGREPGLKPLVLGKVEKGVQVNNPHLGVIDDNSSAAVEVFVKIV